jgi:hypothetical protein
MFKLPLCLQKSFFHKIDFYLLSLSIIPSHAPFFFLSQFSSHSTKIPQQEKKGKENQFKILKRDFLVNYAASKEKFEFGIKFCVFEH